MKIIRFARMPFKYSPYPFDGPNKGKPALNMEIAFSEKELFEKLNGQMAYVEMPGKNLFVRLWRIFFPLRCLSVPLKSVGGNK